MISAREEKDMIKENTWIILRVILSLIIIGLLTVTLLTGIRLSMQIGFVLLGVLLILNIVLNKSKNKIIKILYICSAVFMIFIGLFTFIADSYKPYQDRATDLSYEIRTSLKNPNGNVVDMRNMTNNYAWDTMYILTPYTDVNEFLRKNKLYWYGDKKENIKYLDDIDLLVFTLGSKVSCYAEIKISDSSIDFSEIVNKNNGINSYKADKAIFPLRK